MTQWLLGGVLALLFACSDQAVDPVHDGRTALDGASALDGAVTSDGARAPDGGPAPEGSATLEALAVDPHDLDPGVGAGGASHQVLEPAGVPANKLFVFLPGTGATPSQYGHLLRTAAQGGYHAISLSYVNDRAVRTLCKVSDGPDCKELMRLEILRGEDRSPKVDIDRPNSIEVRLAKLIAHLGWTQYLQESSPRWAAIAVAGHSQGGGHAAMIAREVEVARAILFAATEPANWTLAPRATPSARFFAFVHVEDPVAQHVQTAWQNLEIPGEPTAIEDAEPPYRGSHRLLMKGGQPQDAHSFVVLDDATPMVGERPELAETWRTLIGP